MFKARILMMLFTTIFRFIGFIIRLPFMVADNIYKALNFAISDQLRFASLKPILQFIVCVLLFYAVLAPWMDGTRHYATVLLVSMGVTVWSGVRNESYIASALGSQRWATYRDIKKANLFNPEPALICGEKHHKLVGPAPKVDWHGILVGGAGTGKTSGSIMPTMLSFAGSIVVFDIKGEIEAVTRKYRETVGPVYIINPTKEDTWSYNFLSRCDDSPEGIVECQEIARAIVPDPPGGGGENTWVYQGSRGLVAAISYITSTLEESAFYMANMITTQSPEELADRIRQIKDEGGDDVPYILGQSFVEGNEKSQKIYLETASDAVKTFRIDHEIVRAITPTEGKTFNFEDLESPSTLYLQIPEHKLKQSADLWRLIIAQLLRHLQGRGEKKEPHILVCLDEFPQLGAIDGLSDMLATLRSRNVHVLLACQSLSQIDVKYRNKDVRNEILSNCNYIAVFGANDKDGQEYFSNLAGYQTVRTRSGGRSDSDAKLAFGGSKGQNQGWQETGQPLMRPEDFRDLGEEVVVINRGTFPMRLKKAFHFKHGFKLKNRLYEEAELCKNYSIG